MIVAIGSALERSVQEFSTVVQAVTGGYTEPIKESMGVAQE